MQLTTHHPARVAERVSTLDLLSNGRVELGLGEGSSTTELHPFEQRYREKRGGETPYAIVPGTLSLWAEYERWRASGDGKNNGTSLIGSPATLPARLCGFEASHIDQIILLNQAGKISRTVICDSLKLFAKEVMPEFQAREPAQKTWKQAVLAGELSLGEIDTTPCQRRAIADPGKRQQTLIND